MEMTGRQAINAPRERVWTALNDPDILRQCIPGCQSLEKTGENHMRAVAVVKVGPISARFSGEVTLSELDPPHGYRITGEGQGGAAGFAKGGARVQLDENGPAATVLTYEVTAQVGGRLAQLGGPIIDAAAKQMAAAFFRKLSQLLEAPSVSETSAPAAEPPPPSLQAIPSGPAAAPPQQRPGTPVAWILASIVALLAGILIGRGAAASPAGDWAGLAIGLVVVTVAAAAFELGRRSAQPVVVLDAALLARLADPRQGPGA